MISELGSCACPLTTVFCALCLGNRHWLTPKPKQSTLHAGIAWHIGVCLLMLSHVLSWLLTNCREGQLVNVKYRTLDKKFWQVSRV